MASRSINDHNTNLIAHHTIPMSDETLPERDDYMPKIDLEIIIARMNAEPADKSQNRLNAVRQCEIQACQY